MAFRFRADEPIEKGFRRIGAEQIERARRQLQANADPATEVHEARKGMKRIRALLRLAREGLGDTVFRAENARFRSIAAALATARDDHVLMETVVKLAAESEGEPTSLALRRLKEVLIAHRTHDEPASQVDSRADAEAALERAQRSFKRLSLSPDGFETLEKGLVRNYRKALERRDVAYAENTDDAFHDWRKCVQAHWRHMALLSRAWPAQFEVQIEAGRGLSQVLGEDHDLSLLRMKLSTLSPDALSAGEAQAVEHLIAFRQQALRRAAKPQGDLIFAERPKAHGRRLSAIWHAALEMRRIEGRKKDREAASADPARPDTPDRIRG